MQKVQFEESGIQSWSSRTKESQGLIGFLIRNKVAKDLAQANLVLISVVIVSALFLIFYWSRESEADLEPDSEIISQQQFLP